MAQPAQSIIETIARHRAKLERDPQDLQVLLEAVRLSRQLLRAPAFDQLRGERSVSRHHGRLRRRADQLHPPQGRDRIPPGRHLSNGKRRSHCRGQHAARARYRRASRDRRIRHAEDRQRQHQRAYDHDRGEGRRRHHLVHMTPRRSEWRLSGVIPKRRVDVPIRCGCK